MIHRIQLLPGQTLRHMRASSNWDVQRAAFGSPQLSIWSRRRYRKMIPYLRLSCSDDLTDRNGAPRRMSPSWIARARPTSPNDLSSAIFECSADLRASQSVSTSRGGDTLWERTCPRGLPSQHCLLHLPSPQFVPDLRRQGSSTSKPRTLGSSHAGRRALPSTTGTSF